MELKRPEAREASPISPTPPPKHKTSSYAELLVATEKRGLVNKDRIPLIDTTQSPPTKMVPKHSYIPLATGANKAMQRNESLDMYGDLTPRTLRMVAIATKSAVEAAEKRKELEAEKKRIEEELQKLDSKADEQLIREKEGAAGPNQTYYDLAKSSQSKGHRSRHTTDDPRGTPGKEEKEKHTSRCKR